MSDDATDPGPDDSDLDGEENEITERKVLVERFEERPEPRAVDLAVLESEEAKIAEHIEQQIEFESGAFYRREVDNCPVLNPDEVISLYKRMAKGDIAARDKMILHNLRLVLWWANKYRYYGVPVDDLIQEGNFGLFKAVDRFDWTKGYKFSTYAGWWIRQSITRYIHEHRSQVRLPEYIYGLRSRIKRAAADLRQELDRRPSVREIAEKAECSVEKVDEAFSGVGNAAFSLDQEVGFANGDTGASHGDLFIDENQKDPRMLLIIKEGAVQIAREVKLLLEVIETIPVHFAAMFKTLYGLTEQSALLLNTLESVGKEFKVTRERVRQIRNLVWQTIQFRAPELTLDHHALSDLRQEISFFEEVWKEVKNLSDAGQTIWKRENPVIKKMSSRIKKLPSSHVRASPAFVNWTPPADAQSCGEKVVSFLAFAYEMPEQKLLGHGGQDSESKWARHACGFLMAETGMDPRLYKRLFAGVYAPDVLFGKETVEKAMQTDGFIREDMRAMLAHIKAVAFSGSKSPILGKK